MSKAVQILLVIGATIGMLHAGLFWGTIGLLAAFRWGLLS